MKSVRFVLISLSLFGLYACSAKSEDPSSVSNDAICRDAAAHVESCIGMMPPMSGSCDAERAKVALQTSCEAMQNPGKADEEGFFCKTLGWGCTCGGHPACTCSGLPTESLDFTFLLKPKYPYATALVDLPIKGSTASGSYETGTIPAGHVVRIVGLSQGFGQGEWRQIFTEVYDMSAPTVIEGSVFAGWMGWPSCTLGPADEVPNSDPPPSDTPPSDTPPPDDSSGF